MVRLVSLALLALLVSCGHEKAAPVPPVTLSPEVLFPVPYFPAHETQILGLPVGTLGGWTAACLYSESGWTDAQKAFVAGLEPAGGEGRVATDFTQDFDGDGKKETVSFGAWARGSQSEGNFVLVTRKEPTGTKVLLLKELPGPPTFTVFTLKPDGSLWFGGGADAGEVTMKITWDGGKPLFSLLTQD